MYQNGMTLPSARAKALAAARMDTIRKAIQSRVNERGDGQFMSYHQFRNDDRDDIQDFDNEFLQKLDPGIS